MWWYENIHFVILRECMDFIWNTDILDSYCNINWQKFVVAQSVCCKELNNKYLCLLASLLVNVEKLVMLASVVNFPSRTLQFTCPIPVSCVCQDCLSCPFRMTYSISALQLSLSSNIGFFFPEICKCLVLSLCVCPRMIHPQCIVVVSAPLSCQS